MLWKSYDDDSLLRGMPSPMRRIDGPLSRVSRTLATSGRLEGRALE